ncbi:MAG: NAD-binding protein, partial [Hadesarchaea archaeon]|nr:NAD-binding protein [Hadesarchaea archaeon]
MYLLLGCGDVGYALAEKFSEDDKEIQIIEKNPQKVDQLTELGYEVTEGNFTDVDILQEAGIEKAEVVLITVSDTEVTERALGAINQAKLDLGVSPIVIARAKDSIEVPGLKNHGAAEIVTSSEVLAE